jgi:hypothetical protein
MRLKSYLTFRSPNESRLTEIFGLTMSLRRTGFSAAFRLLFGLFFLSSSARFVATR